MTSSRQESESGDGFLLSLLRFLILTTGLLFLVYAATLDLEWPQQALLGLVTILLAIWVDHSSPSRLITLTLMLLSVYSTARYAFWRFATTTQFFLDPATHRPSVNAVLICLLLCAELYAFTVLLLGYLQSLWPLHRAPVPLPDDPESWPSVDLLIPTFNEPLALVQNTALAALNIDWPADKLNVYVLDDGRREDFRLFCQQAGIGYMTRDDNRHAKAGNINHALERLNAPFVALFDCDHVPTRSFLQLTLGWFVRDSNLAMLQTPQRFYSPDPFERNLNQFHVTPNEEELFYGVVQDGNDLWNATVFCGSCAVLRRTALDEIGGIAVETVTEDVHTSLRLQKNGWNTAYINLPQAAGLATERLRSFIDQRVRWARGMVQILRVDNPLFARGLKLVQRLCYFNAMLHFLYAIPRLIFLLAPLAYLFFGRTTIVGYWAAILAYAIPHLVLATIANSRIHGSHRHSFWNEVYETVVAPYILFPTLLAVIRPSFGRFHVTEKGSTVSRRFFDARSVWPLLLLIVLHLLGILTAIPRLRYIPLPYLDHLYTGAHPIGNAGALALNLIWAVFNLILLGVATSVAWESRQRRHSVRLPMAMPADVLRADGTPIEAVTSDLSVGGVLLHLDQPTDLIIGETIQFLFPVLNGAGILPAIVIGQDGNQLRAEFRNLTLQEQETLALVLYARADTWLGWGQSREVDRPVRSFARILRLSVRGFRNLLRRDPKSDDPPPTKPPKPDKRDFVPTILSALILAAAFSHAAHAQDAQDSDEPAPRPAVTKPVPAPTQIQKSAPLSGLHTSSSLKLHGSDAKTSISFPLPKAQSVKSATIHLQYHASPSLIPSLSQLKISLNGTLLSVLPVTPPPVPTPGIEPTDLGTSIAAQSNPSKLLQADVTLPADSLQPANELTFEFIGHTSPQCEDPSSSALWLEIDKTSTLTLSGNALTFPDDLKLLPAPFFESSFNPRPELPVVFLTQPSAVALKAAGIVASWFGILRDPDQHALRFPVTIGTLPHANAILIAEDPQSLPASLNLPAVTGPTLAIRTNPSDSDAKLLILTGSSPDDLLKAAQALALEPGLLSGSEARISDLKLPAPSRYDDAPRWMSTTRITYLGEIATNQSTSLQRTDADPIQLALHLPPDLYLPPHQTLPLHLNYRFNSIPLAADSSLQVFLNGAFVSSAPLPRGDKASTGLSTVIPISAMNLRPSGNLLAMSFAFQHQVASNCQAASSSNPKNLQGSIAKDSYLDLTKIPHWIKLPNLALFASSGVPFTRKADLSDTAIVFPDTPTPAEIELYLALVAHFAAQTGYPVLNLTVTDADGMIGAQKDYLVLGTLADQPALQRLDSVLPVTIDSSGLRLQDPQRTPRSPFAHILDKLFDHAWWRVPSSDNLTPLQLQTSGPPPDALVETIEWPRGSARSVVLIALRDQDAAPTFTSSFLDDAQSPAIAHSVSILRGTTFLSYAIGSDSYYVGMLPLWIKLHLLIEAFPPILVFATAFVCLLMALVLRSMLRRHARARLEIE